MFLYSKLLKHVRFSARVVSCSMPILERYFLRIRVHGGLLASFGGSRRACGLRITPTDCDLAVRPRPGETYAGVETACILGTV